MTITNSRPVNAESSLLQTIRCLVRTVVLKDCYPNRTPAPTPAPVTPPPAQQPGQQAPAGQAPANPGSPNATQSTPDSNGGVVFEEVELPETVTAPLKEIKQAPLPGTQVTYTEPSEYPAHFNAYGTAAVAGAQTSSTQAPLERSAEGWRVLGVTWYWWAIGAIALAVAAALIRKKILSTRSALPNNT